MAIELRKPYRREYCTTYTKNDGTIESFIDWHKSDYTAKLTENVYIQGGYMKDVKSVSIKRTGNMIF